MAFGDTPLGAAPLGSGGIPLPKEELMTSQGIPVTVGGVSSDTEAPEVKLYKLSFESYKGKECEIDGMDSNNAHATLSILRDVGVYYTSERDYKNKEKEGVEIKPIDRDGKYSVLYQGLVDEQVYEIKLKKDQKEKKTDIRVFYYTIESEKIFYVIAAKHDHIDTSKGEHGRRQRDRNRPRKFRRF
jgi:hypothetical protein